jgi:hypothetical protein
MDTRAVLRLMIGLLLYIKHGFHVSMGGVGYWKEETKDLGAASFPLAQAFLFLRRTIDTSYILLSILMFEGKKAEHGHSTSRRQN